MDRTRFLMIAAAFALAFAAPAGQALALDVDNVIVLKNFSHTNGVADVNGYQFYVEVNVSGLSDGVFLDCETNTWHTLTHVAGNKWEFEQSYATQAALDAAHPNLAHEYFFFNSSGGSGNPPFADEVLLGYAVGPPHLPSGAPAVPNIIYPINNSTGVPLNPLYQWDNQSSLCQALGLGVALDSTNAAIFVDTPETNTGKQTWQPGLLALDTTYKFEVDDFNITGNAPQLDATIHGDAFEYFGVNVVGNDVVFTTSAVPEPLTVALLASGLFVGATRLRRRR